MTINADKRYKLIRKLKVSTASEHDTLHLEDVLDGGNTCRDLYADKGYVDAVREARLKEAGLRTHIQRKSTKGKPLSACQKRRNTRIARSRARVEHVFAGLKHLGGNGVRTNGLARATLQLNLKAAVYNLRRLCSLKACLRLLTGEVCPKPRKLAVWGENRAGLPQIMSIFMSFYPIPGILGRFFEVPNRISKAERDIADKCKKFRLWNQETTLYITKLYSFGKHPVM